MRPRPVIAIDGPAGAGKSSVARATAERLGFTLVDTGALYRAVAFAARREGIAWSDAQAVAALAGSLVSGRRLRLAVDEDGTEHVFIDQEDIREEIRSAEMSMGASLISKIPDVRHALFALQRQAGEQGGVVLEGRDIGTVVFPDAELKFFLTASPEIRAKRRFEELSAKGETTDYATTLEEVKRRDEQDSTRAISPLRRAEDAIFIDSSDMSVQAIVDLIAEAARARLGTHQR
jgi:CMP/dCMP kinase